MSSPSVAGSIAHDRRPPPAGANARTLVNRWTEAEALDGARVRAFVAILRTRGCYWADAKGCSMCGYSRDTLGRSATPQELDLQLTEILHAYRDEPYVKLYTSGSFLDDREVDPGSRTKISAAFRGRAKRLLIETLPEFPSEATLTPIAEAFGGTLEVALGLESSQPEILARFVNKGAPPSAYFEAADRVRELGHRPKAYVLLKPPYLTERESVEDSVETIRQAASHFDTMSVNPVHIQNGTVVEWLYRRGRYRPPTLWSVVEVLRRGAALRGSSRLVSFPTAGGMPRGAHNCGKCDRAVLAAIEEASLDQDFGPLESLGCECRAKFDRLAGLEPLGVEA